MECLRLFSMFLTATGIHCRSCDVTLACTFPVLLWCWLTHIVRICCAVSIAITRGLRHNAKVYEPIRRCDSDFRDVRAMSSWVVTSDFHSV